jgi:hypothetical protein
MTREEDGRELETRMEEGCFDAGGDAMEAAPPEEDSAEPWAPRSRLPWIGALENPRVGPLVVLNESGYLVPLLTAADLLRGCRYYWQRSQT